MSASDEGDVSDVSDGGKKLSSSPASPPSLASPPSHHFAALPQILLLNPYSRGHKRRVVFSLSS
jgi:hypothetical protein